MWMQIRKMFSVTVLVSLVVTAYGLYYKCDVTQSLGCFNNGEDGKRILNYTGELLRTMAHFGIHYKT